MPIELFAAEALKNISYNLIAAVLYDAGRFGLSKASVQSLEAIYHKALKDCSKELEREKADELRQVFRSQNLAEKIYAFELRGQPVPFSEFEKLFTRVLGSGHGKLQAREFFSHFRGRVAGQPKLAQELELLFQERILSRLETFMQGWQAAEAEAKKERQEILDAIRALKAAQQQRQSIEATIGYTAPPELRDDFVRPAAALGRLEEMRKRHASVLIYGAPGSGKSVLANYAAADARAAGQPVFWFRLQPRLTDDRALMNALLPFLQQTAGAAGDNLADLLPRSGALLVIDDLQYATEEKLQQTIALLVRLASAGTNPCTLLLTSRERSPYLPLTEIADLPLAGLAPEEVHTLVTDRWQLSLPPALWPRLQKSLQGNPQYWQFFANWYESAQPDEARLEAYLAHAPEEDDRLRDYLMRELRDALGGSTSDHNRLLQAVSFFRIPASRDFVERLFGVLGGRNFGDTLHDLQVRKGLMQRLPQEKRYTVHDLVREFYYQNSDGRQELHRACGEWYDERFQQEKELTDAVEGGHHLRKAGEHSRAATLLQAITHYCTVRGLYWQPLRHTLERIDLEQLDEALRFDLLYDLGNLRYRMGEWTAAEQAWTACLRIESRSERHHHVFNSLGLVYKDKGEWDQAIEFYQKSIDGLEKVGDIHGIAQTYNNLGLVYKDKGEWDQAIEFYQKSIEIYEKVGDIHGIAQTYNNLGLVYKDKGEWDQAIEFYQKSIDGKEKVGDIHGIAQTYNNLGLVYQDKGEWDQAIEFYQKSIDGKEKVGDIHGIAQTYGNLGNVHQLKGEWDQAIEFYQKSIDGKEKVGDIHGIAQTYGNLSLLWFDQKRYDQAVPRVLEVQLLFIKIGANALVGQVQSFIESFQQRLGEQAFNDIAQNTLAQMQTEGVRWGRHQVLTAEEVRRLLQQQNTGE